MNSKWTLLALLFSVAVNIAVIVTLLFFWRQEKPRQMEVNIDSIAEHSTNELIWFHSPDVSPSVSGTIDSLRLRYHHDLENLELEIDARREKIVQILLKDTISNDELDSAIYRLAQKQTQIERLTIDHLIAIKPLLQEDEWRLFLNDLKPRRKIQTKIIKIGDDTSGLFMDDSEMRIIEKLDGKEIILEHK